jgi:hypothetical protein
MEGEAAAPYTILYTLHNSTNSQCLSNVLDMGSWWALGGLLVGKGDVSNLGVV